MIFNPDILKGIFTIQKNSSKVDLRNSPLTKLIKKPITVNQNTSLIKTREILLENKIKRVIVVSKNRPIGVITEKDIAKKIYQLGSKSLKSVTARDFKPKKLFSLQPEDSVGKCAKLMKRHRISVVIIQNQENLLQGIVTETDLTKAFLFENTTPIKISKIMSKNLITAGPSDPILYIENLLIRYKISRVIIKRNQKPIGIVTLRDFIPAKIPQWISDSADPTEVHEYKYKKGLAETDSNQLGYLFPFHATDIMTPNPITIEKSQDVKDAILLMIKHNISGLPVTAKSKLVGIITKFDIVCELAS